MRQRRGSLLGPLCASEPQTGADAEARFGVEVGVRAQPRHGRARFGSHDARFNRKRFAAGLAAGAEIECPLPAALASRSDLGRIGGWARTASTRPRLTASAPAPISPPAVGTPQCGVL